MVIDTSALIAVIRGERRAADIADVINNTPVIRISAVNAYEARIVMRGRYGDSGIRELEKFLVDVEIAVAAFDADQAFLAYRAYEKYGKGMGHPAQLNMGDCAAYALAKSMDLPLLYVGEDFAKTDVTSAL